MLPDVFAPQKEGGGAPNGAPTSCRAAMRGRSRGPINKRDRSPFGAPPRSCAGNPTRPGPRFLESPDANGRTLSGTSAASTSQSGTRRTGRCPSRLKANSDELRPQEPHPLRQSASPVDVPYDERDGRRYSNPRPRCQRLFDFCRQIAGLRRAIAAARKPGRVSLHAKDSQKRSCACQSRPSMPYESFRGCAAASICLSGPNEVCVPGLISGFRACLDGLRVCRTDHAELGGRKGHSRSAEQTAALMIDVFRRFDLIQGGSP